MSKFTLKFIVPLFMGMAAFGWIIVRAVSKNGDSTYALAMGGIGLLLIVPFSLFLWRLKKSEEREVHELQSQRDWDIQRLKRAADVFTVKAEDIEIRTASYAELSTFLGETEVQNLGKQAVWSILEVDLEYKGEAITLTQFVDRDRHTLKMKILMKKELTLCISAFDRDEYYLDLGFLN